MRRWLVLLVVVTVAVSGAAAVSSAGVSTTGTPSVHIKKCHVGYVYHRFSWGKRCVRAGQYCKKRRNLEYHQVNFQCVNGKLRKEHKKKRDR